MMVIGMSNREYQINYFNSTSTYECGINLYDLEFHPDLTHLDSTDSKK